MTRILPGIGIAFAVSASMFASTAHAQQFYPNGGVVVYVRPATIMRIAPPYAPMLRPMPQYRPVPQYAPQPVGQPQGGGDPLGNAAWKYGSQAAGRGATAGLRYLGVPGPVADWYGNRVQGNWAAAQRERTVVDQYVRGAYGVSHRDIDQYGLAGGPNSVPNQLGIGDTVNDLGNAIGF